MNNLVKIRVELYRDILSTYYWKLTTIESYISNCETALKHYKNATTKRDKCGKKNLEEYARKLKNRRDALLKVIEELEGIVKEELGEGKQ